MHLHQALDQVGFLSRRRRNGRVLKLSYLRAVLPDDNVMLLLYKNLESKAAQLPLGWLPSPCAIRRSMMISAPGRRMI
jgi:hypothetical protein